VVNLSASQQLIIGSFFIRLPDCFAPSVLNAYRRAVQMLAAGNWSDAGAGTRFTSQQRLGLLQESISDLAAPARKRGWVPAFAGMTALGAVMGSQI
jgi:hypothetical protein